MLPHVDTLSRAQKNTCNHIEEADDNSESIQRKVLDTHARIIHRGAKATKEKFEEVYKKKISEHMVGNLIKNCKICKMYNPLKTRGLRKVTSFEVGEKVAIDIVEPKKGCYILTGIDYFSRYAFAKMISNKRTENIIKFLQEIQKEIPIKMLIADGAKENISEKVKKWCLMESIKLHTTSPYHHQSNGRIERFNRTFLESFNKSKMKELPCMRTKRVLEVYNQTWHSGINMSTVAARKEENSEKLKEGEFRKRIGENTSKIRWPKLKQGSRVLIKEETLMNKRKPRFKQEATILEASEFDTYILETGNGRKIKRHASQLKVLTENP